MRSRSPAQRRGGWSRMVLDLAEAKALFSAGGWSAPSDAAIVEAWAHFDRQGRVRRLHFRLSDGWRATVCAALDGSASISWAIKFAGVVKGPA